MFNISIDKFIDSLPVVGIGMLGIFIIIGLMCVLTILFKKIFKA